MIGKLISLLRESHETFEGQEPNEKVIMIIRQHIIVVLISLLGFAFALLAPVILFSFTRTYIAEFNLLDLAFFIYTLWCLGIWISMFRFLTLYSLNTMIITDHRIIDRDQFGFFNQKVSELHADRIQDVTAHTNGILETVFSFGNIIVQTAASEKQFIFQKMPHPEKVKTAIMQIISSHRSIQK